MLGVAVFFEIELEYGKWKSEMENKNKRRMHIVEIRI